MCSLKVTWPKGPTVWNEGRTLFASIPFTWDLPKARVLFSYQDLFFDRVRVGGPAVDLVPDYFDDMEWVEEGGSIDGVLQRVNPLATRTTIGCPNHCKFCAVSKLAPTFHELDDWPDLPIICDDNLFVASDKHVDKVFDRLEKHESPDFQGLDVRYLTQHHAERIARLPKKTAIRIALDSWKLKDKWLVAQRTLLEAGIAKSRIRSYVLIGDTDVDDAWRRCLLVQSTGALPLPMWYHSLGAMEYNKVTQRQLLLGWTDQERKRIMQYYYKHRGSPPELKDLT